MECELTMSELLTDPLIRVLLKADGISLSDFSDFIRDAAARLKLSSPASALKEHHAGPRGLIWHEQSMTGHDTTIEIHKPAFSSLAPTYV
ncbi:MULTISPECIES: hypothetical protein [Rhizobium/Agrobacterium group]|jgi:hypothetical protein|uniref:hypothetical protein n=1 Tax=Rhizobium/Agrobacterium group TaxID=227290 RepID=UPI0007151184|nr:MULTISPECIES: hypothetical protein [Rhizobium/Agrobacterium group]KQY36896.1 hypothetical protein ASD46_20930 [Rhizobium sp. Root491]MDP9759163.1 hypothetical protein [Agrobacterium tumefaciens]MDQ1223591.1 hypothetical protein [Agrobacterium sp. SORGH_AS_0745]MDX8327329.1 hypothetical protein [Agrobacterium tumefaciens]QTQ85895.1 hypothetical protein J8N08_24820 [Agrobacterium tumefaciens]